MCAYVVLGESEAKIEVKKSIFLATVREVHSEKEALAFVEEMRKKYWDAKHNCYAFQVGEKNEIRRFSDDKEPQGTAGKPILEALTTGEFQNTAIVVTRYFGGILLGTGGLVRAYREAACEGLKSAASFPVVNGRKLSIRCSYPASGKIQYVLNQEGAAFLDTVYAEDVSFTIAVPLSRTEEYTKKITEAASGAASVSDLGPLCFLEDGASARIYEF